MTSYMQFKWTVPIVRTVSTHFVCCARVASIPLLRWSYKLFFWILPGRGYVGTCCVSCTWHAKHSSCIMHHSSCIHESCIHKSCIHASCIHASCMHASCIHASCIQASCIHAFIFAREAQHLHSKLNLPVPLIWQKCDTHHARMQHAQKKHAAIPWQRIQTWNLSFRFWLGPIVRTCCTNKNWPKVH